MRKEDLDVVLEEKHLSRTLELAEKQLKQAQDTIEGKQEEMVEAKRKIRENGIRSMGNLYSSEDFEALAELSQNLNPVERLIADCEETNRQIVRLERILKKPYFARIDFRFADEEDEAEQIYIGRASLTEKKTREMVIYDWRSPIAGVFYRFMTGAAFYDAPGGRVEGEVRLKRQYEIENGVLEYFFDADRNIGDEILRQLLSQNTSPKMKAIVETIQSEQDIVIRDMESDLLMVQGVAGSGKTSIALHRAAYLMYQGLQTKLAANSILIVSPNTTFEEYISQVLPELGEENVTSMVFEEMMGTILEGRVIQSRNDYLEHAVTRNRYQAVVKSSMAWKLSPDFQKVLDWFLTEIPRRFIPFEDIRHKGECVVPAQEQREWVLKRPGTPLGIRLEQLEDFCIEKVFGTAKRREDAEERNQIRQQIQNAVRLDVSRLYQRLFFDESCFENVKKCAESVEMLKKIRRYTRENLTSGRIYYEDAVAMCYLHLKMFGSSAYRNIRQVVIDEAQDYYPLQFEIFRMLFSNARFTVLGDINQTLAKQEDFSFYEQVQRILNREKAALITLDKSFRCTNEILNFGLQFIPHRPEIESFNRSGSMPQVGSCAAREELFDRICGEIGLCREKGLKTICLLCKNARNAQHLYEGLQKKTGLALLLGNEMESLEGTFIMPLYQSKGLEFDAVILCDADAENYADEDDRKLLYVACTRALHRLSVFGEGSLSPLVQSTL